MRPIRYLILLLVLAAALLVALVLPVQGRAGSTASTTDRQTRKLEPKRRRHLMAHPAETKFGDRVAKYAKRFIGIRYSWGGSSPRSGFDCSGLVRYVYSHFGVSLPHSSFGDIARGRRVPRSSLRPGDLVFFAGASHVGIYVGRNRFIHAPHSGTVVSIATLSSSWYGAEYDGARRLHRWR